MPDFINLFALVRAHKEAVGKVDDNTDSVPDIAISVDNTFRNKDRFRIVCADKESHHVTVSLRAGSVIPEAHLKI